MRFYSRHTAPGGSPPPRSPARLRTTCTSPNRTRITVIAFQTDVLYHIDARLYVTGLPMSQPIVAYYRVSREKQGRSGLGLDGQRRLISAFAANEVMEIAGEFTEVETGKGADALERRPQLAAALRKAKQLKCPIVVAKLDRLSRDVAFIAGLMA